MDDLNFPICKMNLYNYDPGIKNFILCLCVKNAEAGQRTTEYDEVYAGYLDGTILLCKLRGDVLLDSTQVFKGIFSNIFQSIQFFNFLDEQPITDMKLDIKNRLWFSLSNKEVYFLEENIATKVYEGADGYFGKTLFFSKNKEHVYFRNGNSLMMISVLDEKSKYESKRVIDICPEEVELVDIDLDLSNCIVYGISGAGDIYGKSFFMKPYYSMVNFEYSGEKKWRLLKKQNKKSKN